MAILGIISSIASIASIVLAFFAMWQAKQYNDSTAKLLIEQRAVLNETKDTLQKITVMYESLKAEVAAKVGLATVHAAVYGTHLSPGL